MRLDYPQLVALHYLAPTGCEDRLPQQRALYYLPPTGSICWRSVNLNQLLVEIALHYLRFGGGIGDEGLLSVSLFLSVYLILSPSLSLCRSLFPFLALSR